MRGLMASRSDIAPPLPMESEKGWIAAQPAESRAAFGALCITGVAVWCYTTAHLQLSLAFVGFSPTYFIGLLRHPEWFVGNFPSGAEDFLKSAPMLLYIVADYF